MAVEVMLGVEVIIIEMIGIISKNHITIGFGNITTNTHQC